MALLFFDRYKNGKLKTLESSITQAEMDRGIKLEEHVSIYDDYLKNEAGDGTYGWQGQWTGQKMTVPAAVKAEGVMSGAQRAARVRQRMQDGLAPLLVSMDPKTGLKIFAEEDKDAFDAGYICERCIQYQAVPGAPICNWARKPDDGCGHQIY